MSRAGTPADNARRGASVHMSRSKKSGRTPLSQIKLIESDPAKVRDAVEDIKQKYEEYFGT